MDLNEAGHFLMEVQEFEWNEEKQLKNIKEHRIDLLTLERFLTSRLSSRALTERERHAFWSSECSKDAK